MTFPAQSLACPDPVQCPVIAPADLPPDLPVARLNPGELWYRVYDGTWGYDEADPGYGDARFSPFDAGRPIHRVSFLYLAQNPTAVLLETVFHDVHPDAARLVYEDDLRQMLLAHVALPAPLHLADLRDPVLAEAGIDRSQVVTSPAEHYPCTRRIAAHLYDANGGGAPAQGIVWHSRQAELAHARPALALIVFTDRHPAARGDWTRVGPSQNLYEGPGRGRVDALALQVGAGIVR